VIVVTWVVRSDNNLRHQSLELIFICLDLAKLRVWFKLLALKNQQQINILIVGEVRMSSSDLMQVIVRFKLGFGSF
jgi:hypothetical protein